MYQVETGIKLRLSQGHRGHEKVSEIFTSLEIN